MYINTRNLLGHTTGVQRYTQRVIDYIPENCERIYLQPKKNSSGIYGHIWEQFCLPQKISDKHKTLWSPSNTGPLGVRNQVITIHDTVPFDHPEWLNKKFVLWYQYLQPKLAKRVSHIITISEFSKDRIIEHLKVPEKKVSVVYNGVDVCEVTNDHELSDKYKQVPYLLSVGSLEPRKNIQRLINAFRIYKKESKSDIKLIIVGKKGLERVFGVTAINNEQHDDVIFTGHVSDKELVSLYENAKGFCYPSMYEGFGLPPLEAMLYGVPVLTSNNTSMAELCRGKAILVDPYSIESIAEGIAQLQNVDSRSTIVKKGEGFAKELTWELCAQKTINIITGFEC